MKKSTFALCPRGFGNTSFRLVEAMEFGVIPVYISDIFSLPFPDEINWEEICVLVNPNELNGLRKRLLGISDIKRSKMIQKIKVVYSRYFPMKGCCNQMMTYLKSI